MASGNQGNTTNTWSQLIETLYPDILKSTICVPPVHFNRITYDTNTVANETVLVGKLPVGGGTPAGNQSAVMSTPMPNPPIAATGLEVVDILKGLFMTLTTNPASSQTPSQYQASQPSKHSIWTPQPQSFTGSNVHDSDVRDDFSQHHVLTNLQELGQHRGETMFILSQLNFSSYMNKSSYAAAAAAKRLPRPGDLDKKGKKGKRSKPTVVYSQGDFDVMVIHRQHGILLGELKSVGKNQSSLKLSQAQADAEVAKRVAKAVKQLDKSETVVKHLVSDITPGLTVKKTLLLPYVSSTQLQRVLDADPQLQQEVCQSLQVTTAVEAAKMCMTADLVSDPETYWSVTPDVLSRLSAWWQKRVTDTVDKQLNDQLYLDIVARFVGPATTVDIHCNTAPRVEVRTEGEAVSELGRRLAHLVLTYQQLDILLRGPDVLWLSGPPGTGKTILLILKALQWLRDGNDVYVVSLDHGNIGTSHAVYHQIQMTLANDPTMPPNVGTVHKLDYNWERSPSDLLKALKDVAGIVQGNAASGRRLYVIYDDATLGARTQSDMMEAMVGMFLSHPLFGGIWMTSVQLHRIPRNIPVAEVTIPLRFAPVVQREVDRGLREHTYEVLPYSERVVPAPGDGMKVITLRHAGPAHLQAYWPIDCEQCGSDIAHLLLRRFHVGHSGHTSFPNGPATLEFRDVFILTRAYELKEEVKDASGNVVSPTCGLVRRLRAEGVPVCVLERSPQDMARWEQNVAETAVALNNSVTITFYRAVNGLERKLVIWVPGRGEKDPDDNFDDEFIETDGRLFAMSRCTTQLVVVERPGIAEPDLD
ncbi:uncharacterized protein [Littorina saxatilis]|uniref:uncharacterized protein n=1 Tax=Littorina saxatilis TaxID=31220 RepID=UPI0038B441C2